MTRLSVLAQNDAAESHCPAWKIDIGIVAEQLLKPMVSEKKLSSLRLLEIRHQCRGFLVAVVRKIVEKSPLKNALLRHLFMPEP